MEILVESSSNLSHTSMRSFMTQKKPIILMTATSDGDKCTWPCLGVTELEPGKWGAIANAPKKLAEWEIKAILFSLADGFCLKMQIVNVGMVSVDLLNQQCIQ